METMEVKNESLGRVITKEVVSDACGLGAGLMVGQVAGALVASIPGIGKPLRLLMTCGAFGLEIATMFGVKDQVEKYVDDIFDAVDSIQALFGGKKPNDGTVEASGEVK